MAAHTSRARRFVESAELYDAIYDFKNYPRESERLRALIDEAVPGARTILDCRNMPIQRDWQGHDIRAARARVEGAASRRISASRQVTRASAGTVLIRDWQGKSHQVTVLEHGVLYRKNNYRSLSQVARVITGCRWSGPLFFGLRGHSKEESRGAR
jgi:hypothetical protein